MIPEKRTSRLKRVLFSLFFAVVACGISGYVLVFTGVMGTLLHRGLNPTETPGLNAALRNFVLPFSVGLGVLVFVLSMIGLGRRERRTSMITAETSSRASEQKKASVR